MNLNVNCKIALAHHMSKHNCLAWKERHICFISALMRSSQQVLINCHVSVHWSFDFYK